MNDAPIGVFDSGLGGLTVVRALFRRLPHESIVYVGDTARVPYGPKSPETVRRYSREIAGFLRDEGVKALVVACNTATAHALPMLRDTLDMPVVGVVEPGARAAVMATRGGLVGVIGTAGTIASKAYERAIHAVAPSTRVVAAACPLFVPLVEEGWLDSEPTRLIARSYLRPVAECRVDTLVLGCTHYPLLAPVIGAELPGVVLIDSADETAAEVARVLDRCELERDRTAALPAHRFIATDDPERFLRAGRLFLGEDATIDAVEELGPFD
ncbi:MAG TPA: glutamate racemase [Gemmatimonadaceae bacterium]|nr:glutamate racemase [Gemmatimonadaceae bacterium]